MTPVATIDTICGIVDGLIQKYKTRDPYELCGALGIRVRLKDLGTDIKAFYFYQSRIQNIVLNERISEVVRRILAAHELGHDQLHMDIARLKGFHELELFNRSIPTEYEANLFAAELLIDDIVLMELLSDDSKTFFSVASELYVPAELLDFKLRVLKHKGYHVEAPYIATGNFLKNELAGCFDTYLD